MNSNTIIDLHTHSHCSDGVLSPTELVKQAKAGGVSVFALTDHDTFAGVAEARTECEKQGMRHINGVEISANFDNGTMHVLGYFLDTENVKLKSRLEEMKTHREERNQKIVKKLNELGIPVSYEELLRKNQNRIIGRPHIAEAMIELKAVGDFNEAFYRYLGDNGQAYYPKDIFSPRETIECITDAGGKAFLAHPVTLRLNEEKMPVMLKELRDFGMAGIEAWNHCQDRNYSMKLLNWAEDLDLMISGGSDFHGIKNKDNALGCHSVNENITAGMVSEIFLS